MICILTAGDFALFSGAYTKHAWAVTRAELRSIQTFADQQTAALMRG